MNQQAYAAREQKKLQETATKIRAWEEHTARNPYYRDQASVEKMKEREEEKLMQRVEEYRQKWRSHPCPVQEPYLGDDGYMVVQMPEGWGPL